MDTVVSCDLCFLVKGGHRIPEIRFTTAYAGVTGLDGETGAIVKFGCGAIIIGFRSLASHFIETVSHFSFLGAEFRYKIALFIMVESWAIVMDSISVCKDGSAQIIKLNGFFVEIF